MSYCITSSELNCLRAAMVCKLYTHGCSETVVPDKPNSGRSPWAVRTRGAWPTVHRLAIFRQPVVVSLLAKQASCVQHLRPLSTIGIKTSHVARNTLHQGHCCWFNVNFFPVIMDEEYYSTAGDWEGTDGNLVRNDLLLFDCWDCTVS